MIHKTTSSPSAGKTLCDNTLYMLAFLETTFFYKNAKKKVDFGAELKHKAEFAPNGFYMAGSGAAGGRVRRFGSLTSEE